MARGKGPLISLASGTTTENSGRGQPTSSRDFDSGNNRDGRGSIANIVLDDQCRPSLLYLRADGGVEVDQPYFASARVAALSQLFGHESLRFDHARASF
jgi:hypothetical protein